LNEAAKERNRRPARLFRAKLEEMGFTVIFKPIWTSLSDILPPIPLGFVLAGVIAFVGYSCLPPTILFLAPSRSQQRKLALEMIRALRPHRAVFLLSDDLSVGIYDQADFSRDNLRTPKDVDWRDVVHPLIDIIAMVVIDTRVDSPPVSEEIARLISTNSLAKTVFVVGNRGESPALQRAIKDCPANEPARTVSENELVVFTKKALRMQ
jgi:hypothetical protein